MKIALYSDLHLEVSPWTPPEAVQEADVVVLAGDIGRHTHGLAWAADVFVGKPVIYVSGNHEYDLSHLGMLSELRRHATRLGIHFLERNTAVMGDVRFLGCTLWSGFNLYGDSERMAQALADARNGITDYERIVARGGKKLEPKDTLALHRTAMAWLTTELAKPFAGKTVVVSHFAPHRGCIPTRFEGSPLSPYFVTDLSWLMQRHRVDLWCHGHTHFNTDFVAEGGCRVVSNQRGYPRERARLDGSPIDNGFNPTLLIDVKMFKQPGGEDAPWLS